MSSTPTTAEQQRLLQIIFSNWPELTELDKKIIEIAVINPMQFKALVGEEAINNAKVCLLRQRNNSYTVISRMLKISYKQARWACKDCGEDKAQN